MQSSTKEKAPTSAMPVGLGTKPRQRPTLPPCCPDSTIGAGGLNGRVRNGNGCDPSAMVTGMNCQKTIDPRRVLFKVKGAVPRRPGPAAARAAGGPVKTTTLQAL